MRIDFDALACRPAQDDPLAVTEPRLLPDGSGGEPSTVTVTWIDDLVYLPSVLAPGQSLCLVRGDYVPLESVLDPWTLGFVQRTRAARPDFSARYADDVVCEEIQETVCVLGNVFSRNFQHWIEELFKVVVLERLGIPCRYLVADLPGFAFAFLDHLGVPRERVRRAFGPLRCRRAVFTTPVHCDNLVDHPAVLHLLRRALLGGDGGAVQPGRRLWLDRSVRTHNAGYVINREEVDALLATHGFEVVDTSLLTPAQQIDAVRHAECLAGPHGSQFVHAMSLPEGARVVECFSPLHMNPSVLQICRLLRQPYHQVVGRSNVAQPYRHGRDLSIDCEHLDLVFRTFLATP